MCAYDKYTKIEDFTIGFSQSELLLLLRAIPSKAMIECLEMSAQALDIHGMVGRSRQYRELRDKIVMHRDEAIKDQRTEGIVHGT